MEMLELKSTITEMKKIIHGAQQQDSWDSNKKKKISYLKISQLRLSSLWNKKKGRGLKRTCENSCATEI